MKSRFAALVSLVVLCLVGFVVVCHGVSEADAEVAVANANQRVIVCYLAVADADKAGANVSDLLVTLNDAGVLVSEARLALAIGNFDSASALAGQCMAKLDGFENAAGNLRDSASQAGFTDFWVNIVGSSVGAVAVVAGGFLVWWFLNKRWAVKTSGT